MITSRPPRAALQPFVEVLWATEPGPEAVPAPRELVLPTGAMHLVVLLSARPLRLFADTHDPLGREVGHALVGGVREAPFVRDISSPPRSVGAMLRPGFAELVLGAPVAEFSGRHTDLEQVWGREAGEVRERLQEAGSPRARLDLFETLLFERVRRARAPHPMVAHAVARLEQGARISTVVEEVGYSHRRFIDLFEHAVGTTPKTFSRLLRFRAALARLFAEPERPLLEIALATGYSDQSHFIREFRAFAGLSPSAYRALHPSEPHHVALVPQGDPAVTPTSISSKTGATRPQYVRTSSTERGDKP